jgi:putative flippase GtrA
MPTVRFPWATFARHQFASLVATGIDLALMVLLVERVQFDPTAATLLGAAAGAIVNFAMNRNLTFDVGQSALVPQAGRYALVSAVSALLNAAGEFAGTHAAGFSYFPLRIVVSALVSVAWNFPMQRSFVFRAGPDTTRRTATGLS